MKRMLSLCLAATLLFGMLPPARAEGEPPLPSGWAAAEWAEAERLRFLPDYDRPNPGEAINQEQLGTLLLDYLALQYNYGGSSGVIRWFGRGYLPGGRVPDIVPPDHSAAYLWAYSLGLMDGWVKEVPATRQDLALVRLWKHMPMSRCKGNIAPIVPYEEEVDAICNPEGDFAVFHVTDRYEGELATVFHGFIGGVMHGEENFVVVYRSGGTGRFWRHYDHWAWHEYYRDFRFSEDGTKLYYTVAYGGITVWYQADLHTGETVEIKVETGERE